MLLRLPQNPNAAILGDKLLVHSGESSPFKLKGVDYWHYPIIALSAKVTPVQLE